MTLKEQIELLSSKKLEDNNAAWFLETIPDVSFAVSQKLEEAIDRRDMKKLFLETMEAGVRRSAHENNPKLTQKRLDDIAVEELHEERLDLIEHESVVRKWEQTHKFLNDKLWSSKSIFAKYGEK